MSIALSPQLTASVGRTGCLPAHLLELQDVNGNSYAWADRKLTAPSIFSGEPVAFQPWLLEVPQLTISRSLTTPTGNFTVQNVSGDTLARDFDKLLRASAIEGALFYWRIWQQEAQDSWFDWSGTLSLDDATETEGVLAGRDIYDVNRIPAHGRQYGERCPLLWGSNVCGVTIVPPSGDDDDVTPVRTPPVLITITPLPSASDAARPNYLPTPFPGGGGPPGSPGNPGQGGGSGGTVSSSVECKYSFLTCQVVERFQGFPIHYEQNFGETLARMAGTPQVRLRKV